MLEGIPFSDVPLYAEPGCKNRVTSGQLLAYSKIDGRRPAVFPDA